MDSTRLESLKNKDERAQTAKSSQEVREHLAGFIRSKQGSSTQLNSIASQQKLSDCGGSRGQQATNQNHLSAATKQASTLSNQDNENNTTTTTTTTGSQAANGDADHPLRKTASMPTMHVPYKAQSLNRRRQMERRTTMSPLMVNSKRKSRPPRRPLLHSLTDEYSSNPCILHASNSSARSLSQSSSPPASSSTSTMLGGGSGGGGGGCDSQQTQRAGAMAPQAGCSHHNHHYNHHNHHRSQMMKSSSQTHLLEDGHRSGGQSMSASQTSMMMAAVMQPGADHQEYLRLQNHQRVQEALRRTVLSRATSRGRMPTTTGGSLDSETSAAAAAFSSASATGGGHSLSMAPDSGQPPARLNRDELRQWSLDGADLRTSGGASWSGASRLDRSLAWSLFHRELARLRLATTSDAATLRRSQSPSSSISMGGVGVGAGGRGGADGPTPGEPTRSHHQQQQQQQQQQAPAPGTQTKLFSSSSSSVSSLLSGQDSLEDSSSQAIDLSSSSEANRQRKQQLFMPTNQQRPAADDRQQQQQQQNGFNYQKMLQDSFNQLQLCRSRDAIKQMLLPTCVATETSAAPSFGLGGVLPQTNHHLQQQQQQQAALAGRPPRNDMGQDEFYASLAQQFNLSASAQNLISSHQQQQQQQQHLSGPQVNHNLFAPQQQQQQQDLNHWLLAYNQLVQSAEFEQSGDEINSSLLTKISSLPEPYRSALVARMLSQQQQQQPPVSNHKTQLLTSPLDDNDQKSLLARTLSSPVLINNLEVPMQTCDEQQGTQMLRAHDESKGPVQFALGGGNCGATTTKLFHSESIPSRHSDNGRQPQQQQQQYNSEFCHAPNTAFDLSLSGAKSRCATELAYHEKGAQSTEINKQKLPGGGGGKTTAATRSLLNESDNSNNNNNVNCYFLYNPIFDANSRTGLVYELELCNHKCICQDENNHPENSFRVLAIWRRLHDSGLMSRCARVKGRRASLSELLLCHGETYSNYFGRSPYERIKLRHLDLSQLPIEGLTQLECGGQGADIDTAWNEEQTPGVARLAAGCVIEAAVQVATGKLLNAFAVVRPPGHHAEHQQAMGFCFFNSIAIAARALLSRHPNLVSRVLIVDWDVHHGNGLQKTFYEDKQVMYISLHRHDRGNFFPGTGNLSELGAGPGAGHNLNVAWSDEIMGDAEYLAAFRSLVMPVARDFDPSIVLVASGFDGSRGHPFNFGGYDLSPACFAHMTSQLSGLAGGRLVLCLEGGYQLKAICDCAEACVRALLNASASGQNGIGTTVSGDQVSESELTRAPNTSARNALHQLSQSAAKYWPSVARMRDTIDMSALEAASRI